MLCTILSANTNVHRTREELINFNAHRKKGTAEHEALNKQTVIDKQYSPALSPLQFHPLCQIPTYDIIIQTLTHASSENI